MLFVQQSWNKMLRFEQKLYNYLFCSLLNSVAKGFPFYISHLCLLCTTVKSGPWRYSELLISHNFVCSTHKIESLYVIVIVFPCVALFISLRGMCMFYSFILSPPYFALSWSLAGKAFCPTVMCNVEMASPWSFARRLPESCLTLN